MAVDGPTVTPARDDQKATVANLIQLYLYDMTESLPFPVGPDGRFGYDFLDRFWQFPYLIRSGPEIAGFALVIDQCPLTDRRPCFFMAEFFVLKAYRRRGIGQAAVDEVIARHPGNWHVAVPVQNRPALGFWGRVLEPRAPVIEGLAFEGDVWRLHAFAGPSVADPAQ
jgi:predicted acetyltransferase